MGRTIKVDTAQLTAASKQIGDAAGDYRQLYERLYGDVRTMSQAWQGKDNLAFTDQIEGFHEEFKTMADALDWFAGYLSTAAKTYEEAQNEVIAHARQLAG